MGRGKIRRRKKNGRFVRSGRKRSQREATGSFTREPDVIGDLEDQAEWSSFTQDIPRLGNPYRESLRLKRMYRFYRGIVRPTGKIFDREPTLIARGLGIAVGVGLLVLLLWSWVDDLLG